MLSKYRSRFDSLVSQGRIKAGSPEERFARHRYRFAKVTFDLDEHNRKVGYNEWKKAQYSSTQAKVAPECKREPALGKIPEGNPKPSNPRKGPRR